MASLKRRSIEQATAQQPTIQQHFESSERKRAGHSSSSEAKRRRTECTKTTPPEFRAVSNDSMYNFTSNKTASVDVATPNGTSPRARRISNLGTLSMRNAVGGPSFGTKKLVVKNLRPKSAAKPTEYISSTTKELDGALAAIFKSQPPAQSNEELYKGAENVCKLGYAAELAKMVERRSKDHITSNVRPVLIEKADDKNVNVLRAVVEAWQTWHAQMVSL